MPNRSAAASARPSTGSHTACSFTRSFRSYIARWGRMPRMAMLPAPTTPTRTSFVMPARVAWPFMKIRDVRAVHFSSGQRNLLVAVVETEDGLTGIGESGTHTHATAGAIQMLAPRLIGQDATRIEHLWQLCFRGGFFPGGNILSAAVSAIDIALWDVNGKALGVPVYRLLGGLCRDRVPVYCHIGGHALDGVVESARERVAEGWKFVR